MPQTTPTGYPLPPKALVVTPMNSRRLSNTVPVKNRDISATQRCGQGAWPGRGLLDRESQSVRHLPRPPEAKNLISTSIPEKTELEGPSSVLATFALFNLLLLPRKHALQQLKPQTTPTGYPLPPKALKHAHHINPTLCHVKHRLCIAGDEKIL